ncbi:PAS domain-containing protein [Mucilaginibacter sp. SMC90]|uniref:PAS domain-containing sensor histidine kinase n=1 Tax=Mucilaginibacter sp. SMC90 TaxID=2929803 RepID=UPI001FB4A739|nr:ATP-binding protein [Mucilaginibacter sp. SMC90]UOE47055.1 PAS domain-containing protein [Mucilaginibacter sp. SMC90]
MEPTENLFRSIVEASPFPVYMCMGREKLIAIANGAALKAWGKDKSVIGKPFDEALPDLNGQPFSSQISEVYHTGETYYGNNEPAEFIIDGKRQINYYKFTYQAVRNSRGKIVGVICFSTDVTEIEHARQAMEESRHTLYNMVKQAPVGICIINSDNLTIEVVNDSYLELVGRKRSEMENRGIWDAIPETADLYAPVMDNVIETGQPITAKEHKLLLVRNGIPEMVFIDFVYEPIKGFNGEITAIMVIAIDVTEKFFARRKIEEAEERARLAVEAAEIGTFDLDLITDEILTSERFNIIFGVGRDAPRDLFIKALHPDDVELRTNAHKTALTTGKLFYEARIIWPNGSQRWIRAQGKVYYGSVNKPLRILGTLLDITEFKHLQQQKDDFISVASHELKTPMTSIKASMQLLDRLIKVDPSSDKIPQFINRGNNSLNKMQQLVDSLLNVSKITAGQLSLHKTRFPVAQMINECCDHVRLAGTHELELTGDTGLELFADRQRIDQVVVNFVNNAVKYAPDSNRIVIHIAKQNDMAKISVQDFGKGIPEEKIPHLFERYYRVDTSGIQYSGLGLGLYISAEIIERHGGEMGVESEVGKGSTFWFTIPLN